jgi:O-antigen ligase
MGNSNLLGFVALLGLIVFAAELIGHRLRRGWGVLWILVALVDLALTRSATVAIATVLVVVAAAVILLLRRAQTDRGRTTVSLVSIVVVVLGAVGAFVLRAPLLRLLNKSSTLTGRTGIWHEVIVLANQRPVVGWGWISYWVPGLAPFARPEFRIGGIQYLQAHDAWLDLWLQLGIVGVVVFAAFALSTLVRSWLLAVDRLPAGRMRALGVGSAVLVPALIVVALLAQSVTESRLLIEYGFFLLSLFALKTKQPDAIARA